MKRFGSMFLCLIAVMALVAVTVSPALADERDRKTSSDRDGDADSDSSTSYNEDNDTNDGGTNNNVSDDDDNAHPSGKDRSVENGKSGNQGRSESNPDDSKGPQRYEGERGDDKPNGPGGEDLADQDGNNGCGNDDDFDDDNNGHCGRSRTSTKPSGGSKPTTKPSPAPTTSPSGTSDGCPNKHQGVDEQGNGANRSGPYDNTCDGSPSLNGNGNGSASGRPCAGCVGNADDKNPRGQYPDGTDHNKGYECDENSGIGRTNPAHTGCKPVVGSSPVCPAGTDLEGMPVPATGCDLADDELCPAGTDLAGMPVSSTGCNLADNELCPAGTDMAGLPPGPNGCNDEVLGRVDSASPKVCPSGPYKGVEMSNLKDCELPPRVLPQVIRRLATPLANVARRAGAVLPFTGAGDLYFAGALSMLLMALGAVAMRLRREES